MQMMGENTFLIHNWAPIKDNHYNFTEILVMQICGDFLKDQIKNKFFKKAKSIAFLAKSKVSFPKMFYL